MKKSTKEADDSLFGLKYIAYCRTGLHVNPDDEDSETIVSFAKWQICKVRNVLWNDPIWESYTDQELLIEYFCLKFDENDQLRKEFESKLVSVKKSDLAWMEAMEAKYLAEQGKISEEPIVPVDDEFEVKFGG